MLAEKTENPQGESGQTSPGHDVDRQKYILLQVALRLFHQQGYGKTTFANIAKAAGMTRKDAQTYFSTREEICHQVIDHYLADQSTQFEEINQNSNPRQRLSLFLDSIVENTDSLISRGCPLTGLYIDVQREGGPLADHVTKILQHRLDWIREQFVLIMRVESVTDLPERLTSAVHGISILAQVTGNDRLISCQVNQLKSWIRSM